MAPRVDWASILRRIQMPEPDGREHARALWVACTQVVDHPDDYAPLPFGAFPPLLDHKTVDDLEGYIRRASTGDDQVALQVARTFGGWRAHVTEVEALNAARLQMLASTLRTLADLMRRSTNAELVSARIAELGDFIERKWRTAIPLQGDIRTWASRITRRYDLLPFDWREL